MGKVHALLLCLVRLFPITVDRQNFIGAPLNGDDVWQSDAVFIFVSRQVVIDLRLGDLVPIILCDGIALILGFLLLYVRVNLGCLLYTSDAADE